MNSDLSIINEHQFFRVHCFNKYGKNKNKNCPDLELTYYIECSEQIDLDLRENHMRRRGKESSDDPIICQQARIPNNIIGGLKGGEVATATPILVPWTSASDSGPEQMIATTNDGNMETLETSSSPAGVDPRTTPQEDLKTAEVMITTNGGIVETLETSSSSAILDPWTTQQEDSETEEVMTHTNGGNVETLETSSSPAGVDPRTTSQEYFETEEMMTAMHGGIVETLGTTDTFEWAAEVTEMT